MISTYYIYSLIGIQLFGGMVYAENPDIYKTLNVPYSYVYNNFNDFPSGLVTLFELMVVNNWWVIAQTFLDVTNNYYRWFFIMFYLTAVIIVLNLLVAFVIDMFNSQ